MRRMRRTRRRRKRQRRRGRRRRSRWNVFNEGRVFVLKNPPARRPQRARRVEVVAEAVSHSVAA